MQFSGERHSKSVHSNFDGSYAAPTKEKLLLYAEECAVEKTHKHKNIVGAVFLFSRWPREDSKQSSRNLVLKSIKTERHDASKAHSLTN